MTISAIVLTQAGSAQDPLRKGQRRQAPPGGLPDLLFQVLDVDHDGALSPSEIDAAATRLRERDSNKDGKLTADELPTRPQRGRPMIDLGPMESSGGPQKPALPKDDGEKRILDALAEARKGQRYANVSEADGRLMRQLTEAVNAKRVVELGTSTGESGLWFSLALRKTGGRLFTHDIDPGRIAVARENFKRAGVDDLITIVEGDAHQTAGKNTDPIDVLFIDAEKTGYDAYLKELLPLVRPGGLIIAHNMRTPTPNPRYIEAITTNPDLDSSFVLMDGAGVGITLKKR
jgi:predicted O-methyltransferase YrrM